MDLASEPTSDHGTAEHGPDPSPREATVLPPPRTCITSERALWRRLTALNEGERLELALCTEVAKPAPTSSRRRRRTAPQERTIVAVREGGHVRLHDPWAPGGPVVDVDAGGIDALARYFDGSDGFSYVELGAVARAR